MTVFATATVPAVDAALRDALADVNRAYLGLPESIRDRLDVSWDTEDDALSEALRGDEAMALSAIGRWRDGNLARIAEAGRTTVCCCDSPLAMGDEHGEVRCLRCGRGTL